MGWLLLGLAPKYNWSPLLVETSEHTVEIHFRLKKGSQWYWKDFQSWSLISLFQFYPRLLVLQLSQIPWKMKVNPYWSVVKNTLIKISAMHPKSFSAVHVLLSRFYPDFIQVFFTDFLRIFSRFYPDFILILSWFYPDFIQIF